jgi:hypothetical protein
MRISLSSSVFQFAAKLKRRALRLYASNFLRAGYIASQRRRHFDGLAIGASSRAIIVIAPGRDIVNDGVTSIISIAGESEKLRASHGADVFVTTCPGEPPLLRYTKFPNDRILFDFQFILERLAPSAEVLVHVPEVYVSQFLSQSASLPAMQTLRLRFNVLLQNVDMIPQRRDIVALQEIGPVTVMTAHETYANAQMQQQLGCLIHPLSLGTSTGGFELSPPSDERIQASLRTYYEKHFLHLPSAGTRELRWASKYYASNYVRVMRVDRERRKHLDGLVLDAHARAIILIVPGRDLVNGGIMSIVAIALESEKLRSVHGADVFVCTCPGDPPLLRYTKFPNNRVLLDFKAVLKRLDPGKEVLVHIPELYAHQFASSSKTLLASGNLRWRFNIMLQNIDMIPQRSVIAQFEEIGPVTVTTAHDAYANKETQRRLGCALHHLSAWPSMLEFERRPFAERENILVISPDPHEMKDRILAELMGRLPDFQVVMVQKMTYMEYRELVAKAKFSLTFGEGFDGYFCEMIMSGGIGCAVYNERFFTKEFSGLPFIYPSWDDLVSRLPDDIRAANAADEFARVNGIVDRVLAEKSSAEKFRQNLACYYEKYFPQSSSAVRLHLTEIEKT